MDKEDRGKPIATEKKPRNLIAIDQTVVRANRKRYFVYAAMDVERQLMRVYPTRNWLTTKSFVREVLNCENKPRFIVDKDPCLIKAESLNLEFEHEEFQKV